MQEEISAGMFGAVAPRRPRLLFTPARVERVRRHMSANAAFAQRWQQLRQRGQELLDRPWITESAAAEGSGQHANYGEIGRQMVEAVQTLGLLHQVEPDERWARKICQGLRHFAAFHSWCAPSFAPRQPPWHAELITASLSYAFALGYDLLHDRLSPDKRRLIAGALVDKGVMPILNDWLLPQTRIHALDSMGHNWWIVMLSAAGIAALALLGDLPQAADWVAQIDNAVPLWFGYGGNVLQNKVANFDSGGAFYEGVNYTSYALREYLLYRTLLTDALPDYRPADAPELLLVERFLLHTLYPTSRGFMVVNFGDAHLDSGATLAMRLLIEQQFAGDYAPWYVARTTAVAEATEPQSQALALLFASDQPIKAPVDLPTSALFPDSSWAVLRSDWQDDATLLAVHAGTYWNHAHADSASYVLFHHGEQLIQDAGCCAYARPEYRDYYCAACAHNVVLVDGQGAPPEDFMRGSKFPGKVRSLLDDGGLKYVYADATGPMADKLARHYRHWLWLDDVIVIFDDLLAHTPASFNWLLHYTGTAQWDANGAAIRNGPAQASVRLLYPPQLQVRQVTAPAQDNADAQVPYLDFATCGKTQQQNFLTTIVPGPLEPAITPRVELIAAPNMLGVRISGPVMTTDVYFNLGANGRCHHQNSNAAFDGWETDAYLLAISRATGVMPGQRAAIRRLLVIDGSYLRRDGAVLLDSLSKVDCLVIPAPNRLRLSIHGQRDIALTYGCDAKPQEVLVNGSPHPFDYAADARTVRFEVKTLPHVR